MPYVIIIWLIYNMFGYQMYAHYTHQKSLATLDGEFADPEITVKLEMWDVLKVHDEQT